MKKKVLCVFFLIFLTLTTCTILSLKIEEEMTLEVVGWKVKCDYVDTHVPPDMLFSDEEGIHAYEVYEGTGWESGLRAREVKLDNGTFLADRDYIIVRGSSRQPVYGELAQLYDGTDTVPSTYLAVYPNGIPEENEMLYQAEILEKSENVLLLYVENGVQPFTENRAKGGMVQLKAPGWQVYSLDALAQLLESIPMTAVAFVILFALAVLGILTCVLTRDTERNWVLLTVNAVLITGLLAALVLVLKRIDYPASMLPPENIFDLAHYRSECTAIFAALGELASETTQAFADLRADALRKLTLTLTTGGAAVLLFAGLEAYMGSRRKKGLLKRER